MSEQPPNSSEKSAKPASSENDATLSAPDLAKVKKPIMLRTLRIFKCIVMGRSYRSDLVTARWTRVLGLFTIVLAAASVASDCIIFRQLGEMRSSSEQIERSINISDRTANIANSALVDVQRAFLFVDNLKITEETDTTNNTKTWHYEPILTNSGNTPALNVVYDVLDPHSDLMTRPEARIMNENHIQYYEWSAKIGAPQDPDDVISADELASKPYITKAGPIGPRSDRQISNVFGDIHINSNETANADALSGKIGRFIFGSVRYDDIFGKSHITKFCFTLDGFSLHPTGNTPLPPHRCRHWNCTDHDECTKDKADYEKELDEVKANPKAPFKM